MRYVYVQDVIGTSNSLSGFAGASAPYSAAVEKLQLDLQAFAEAAGNMDYHPGKHDGLYGKNTHAAVIRVTRDYLIPRGSIESTCQSTCNTLWARAAAACAECLGRMLASMNNLTITPVAPAESGSMELFGLRGTGDEMEVEFPEGIPVDEEPSNVASGRLTDAEIAEVVAAYRQFMVAYVAEYGDGGQLDPQQIMRREDVDRETAERLAEERRRAAEVVPPAPTPHKAGFSWWWLLLLAGVGGAAWYAYRKSQEPEDVSEYSGCGCGE
jgi:hypothetical protein